ncbi:translation factor SUA5 [Knoellia remsis]|uniref:L-threonylcarbamoyladenylate synthase n=1 Tax=Knoellia remsis TaxID=407159 RepID=A0A2T0UYA5_9MICO|nr:L-threonylcarbamoyladenylate synthase [Knoellia remsis]PRY62913.1 translation factor SUA5 [Knoellia remsis]
MSPVFDCTTPEGRLDGVTKATAGVRQGDLVVLPTDTLYGIGADAFSPDAVQRLLDAKGRGREMPPPVLVAETRTLDGLATDVPQYARALVERYWPGPLTVILKAQPSLMWDLGETGGTVALRMPDNEVALELLSSVGPMAVSSANRTGHPASRTIVEAATQLGASVEFYLDGGPVAGGLPSTIVDCTGAEPVVLRRGAIDADEIMAVAAEHLELPTEQVEDGPATASSEPPAEEPAATDAQPAHQEKNSDE